MDSRVASSPLAKQIEALRSLAAEWRDRAALTDDAYYIELMVRTAQELETRARELEAKPRGDG